MTYREITAGENTFVRDLLSEYDETIHWIGWIKKEKREKIDERLLVVGDYRVFTIKRGLTGKKSIRRDGHLYELQDITSKGKEQVLLTFSQFFIDIQSPQSPEIIQAIRQAYAPLTINWPEEAMFSMDIPDSRLLEIEPPEVRGGGFIECYQAMCNRHLVPVSLEVVRHVEDCIDQDVRELDLSDIPGIELNTSLTFDLKPIVGALRYNTYFNKILLKNVPRKDAVLKMAETTMCNSTITSLTLSGVQASEGFVALGNSMTKNPDIPLAYLDLSYNNVQDKGIQGLAIGLQSLEGGLRSLNLQKCSFGSKGVKWLTQSFEESKQLSCSLTEINLSNNSINNDGSAALAGWLNALRFLEDADGIKYLGLANTHLDVPAISSSIRTACHDLRILDLNNNKIDNKSASALAEVLRATSSLVDLDISNCNISRDSMEIVVHAMLHNDNISGVRLDISSCNLGVNGSKNVEYAIRDSCNIEKLNMSDNKLKAEGITRICEALMSNETLKCLILDRNLKKDKHTAGALTTLAKLISIHPSMETLSVAGSDSKLRMGAREREGGGRRWERGRGRKERSRKSGTPTPSPTHFNHQLRMERGKGNHSSIGWDWGKCIDYRSELVWKQVYGRWMQSVGRGIAKQLDPVEIAL
eukprot:TRINITY_DN849_c0_g2_i2.p1 TRINITY_DN849_c0_g2~~TRINITY_DN849_c0_g2_i2.p1  ORF type:complete len:642 (-),score=163.56 TRINITY_DN849_c0_g2_i2:1040-2965(-)